MSIRKTSEASHGLESEIIRMMLCSLQRKNTVKNQKKTTYENIKKPARPHFFR